ncbi:MAG: sulfotransferase family 2 domain-containing protein [Cyanobacteriota bacterium]|nr:sulfotransferase family 2 domain-containing protein [Cyanobacteriota bacterium]
MTKTILVHHHIFKNAGTSFNYALQSYFGDRFIEFDLPNSQVVSASDLEKLILKRPEALAISSHHACMPTPQGENYRTISSVLLRKPLSRIKSIYKFETQQDAATEGAIKAKKLDFKEYVIWRLEQTPVMFCNYQTHYCSRQSDRHNLPTEKDLQVAIINIKKCLILGTVERYQDSLKIATNELRNFYPDIDLEYQRLNITSHQQPKEEVKLELIEELGEKIVKKLEAMNQLDEKLYQVAEYLVNEKIRSIPPSPPF